jgi:hypothetical protein
MKDLLEMEDMFLPFDYTKHQPISDIAVISPVIEQAEEIPIIIEERRNSTTPSSLLRRVGGALDQNRYKSQGYHEISNNEEIIPLEDEPVNHKIK